MTCPLHPEQTQPCATCGINRVRAALAAAPQPIREGRDPLDPTRAAALARARTERNQPKEQQ